MRKALSTLYICIQVLLGNLFEKGLGECFWDSLRVRGSVFGSSKLFGCTLSPKMAPDGDFSIGVLQNGGSRGGPD
jgi:hypothetical protein